MVLAYSIIPGVMGPYCSSSLYWNDAYYYYVYGKESSGSRRLVEVFQVDCIGELEPMLSFRYPPPFRELFPEDYALLYSEAPAGK
ncbi:hypothetical protein LMG23994_05557 [Cupriavidus pinatubonensis]|uniref:Lipoprotein n=1 Tax=Cupriavidus pinatubonensis TaxID=248026 RepID=A0ABN7ZJS3_9BURK|nr:hypothetical protein LMG23994_05557 [Cupriavidus pinatubonensis]